MRAPIRVTIFAVRRAGGLADAAVPWLDSVGSSPYRFHPFGVMPPGPPAAHPPGVEPATTLRPGADAHHRLRGQPLQGRDPSRARAPEGGRRRPDHRPAGDPQGRGRRDRQADRERPRLGGGDRVRRLHRLADRAGAGRRRRASTAARSPGRPSWPTATSSTRTTRFGSRRRCPPGSSAAMVLIEHLWAIPLRDAIRRAEGHELDTIWVTPDELVRYGLAAALDEDAGRQLQLAFRDGEAGGRRLAVLLALCAADSRAGRRAAGHLREGAAAVVGRVPRRVRGLQRRRRSRARTRSARRGSRRSSGSRAGGSRGSTSPRTGTAGSSSRASGWRRSGGTAPSRTSRSSRPRATSTEPAGSSTTRSSGTRCSGSSTASSTASCVPGRTGARRANVPILLSFGAEVNDDWGPWNGEVERRGGDDRLRRPRLSGRPRALPRRVPAPRRRLPRGGRDERHLRLPRRFLPAATTAGTSSTGTTRATSTSTGSGSRCTGGCTRRRSWRRSRRSSPARASTRRWRS